MTFAKAKALKTELLTRSDWNKRFGISSVAIAFIACVASFGFGYHAIWLAFILLGVLYSSLRITTPSEGKPSAKISYWSLLLIPILYATGIATVVFLRYLGL